jgi:hypothetical protein
VVTRTAVVPPPHTPVPYLCECDRLRCTEILLLTQAEYAEASGGLRRLVVAPGHHVAGGRVVHEDARYWAVERGST